MEEVDRDYLACDGDGTREHCIVGLSAAAAGFRPSVEPHVRKEGTSMSSGVKNVSLCHFFYLIQRLCSYVVCE